MNTDSVTIFLDKSPLYIANQLITAIIDDERKPSQEAIDTLDEIAAYIRTWASFRPYEEDKRPFRYSYRPAR
jgi:hypothetical protein